MTDHHQLICRALEEFANRLNAGENCWVTFEANGEEHWLQCARGQINMDWPFSHAPKPERMEEYLGALVPLEIVAWESDLYATISIAKSEIEALALAVERLFREFYELGPEYDLVYKLEDA